MFDRWRRRNARAALTLMGALALGASAAAPLPAHADDGERPFYGLLRVRDLTPFGFRRLDMRPSQAALALPQAASVEVDVGYQNTWSLSRGVVDYLRARPGRQPIGEQDAAAIRALPGENYLVDLELGLVDIAFDVPLSERAGAYAVLSAAEYTGGFLDAFVEGFHRAFGLGDASRPKVTRNQINLLLNLRGEKVEQIDMAGNSGLLDPVVGLRYTLLQVPGRANVVGEAALKVPLGRDGVFSTNRLDAGAQLTAQATVHRHAFYASASMVWYAGSARPLQSAMWVPTAIVGYEYRFLPHDNLIVQAYTSRGVFTSRETELAELRGNKFLLSVGLRHRIRRSYVTFAFTENLRNFNNTPDVGFQLGVGHTF